VESGVVNCRVGGSRVDRINGQKSSGGRRQNVRFVRFGFRKVGDVDVVPGQSIVNSNVERSARSV